MAHRQRYQTFSRNDARIHLLKRMAWWMARCLPKSWRFRMLGLPARSTLTPFATKLNPDFEVVASGIACQNGAHLDASGRYIPHLSLGSDRFIEFRFLQRQRHFPVIIPGPPALLSLASEGDLNYYRWLLETLPRFRFIEESAPAFDSIYSCQQHRFHRESLRLFAGPDISIIPSEASRFVQAPRLVLPRFVNETETWVIPWMREKILPQLKSVRPPGGSRLYVTRRGAGGRGVVNEKELMAELQPLGFQAVELEKMPWLEQARLFRDAEAIVAPHGAGLANLIFASPGTLAIELIAPGYPFTFYPEICRRTKVRHHLVHGQPVDPQHVHRSDLIVDIPQIRALLD